ncbi:T9SS-dependent choice-of-anchor J family protein [Chryseobacterium taiwanense]|uniref:Cleaved adhesin domain-containing protein n=1 Tax=Chryseobacterium taiwanense TaxID=363331 RepID=A0A0B4ECA7_9FLAO|nr:choice-of-anchor J domain-containing protein [Chryseobacterium taiwanense]KIC64228.1 hypothetical protein RM51_05820 [Chryseobacterium taiwanense]
MKLKLLLGALALTAINVHAQVATINENFNSFATGSTSFPFNGWTSVLPGQLASPPAPMMVIYAETGDATNKYVSSYSGGNSDAPQYLVSPQIEAPTGNKTLTFKARKNSAGAPVILQVGLASSPTDMTTFVAVGAPVTLATATHQTISRVIPSSTSSYIVFKTVNATTGVPHTATDIDDVSYDVTPVGTINENFNSFTVGASAIPQNGWNKVINTVPHNVYTAANNGSTTIQFYSGGVAGATAYLVSPKIVAPDGSKKLRFTTNITASSTGNATIEVGMVSGTTAADMATFTSLGSPITLAIGSTTPQTITLDVPTSTSQYIAWRFVGAATHSAAYVDDVIYDVLGSLATSETKSNTSALSFAINADSELQFVGKSEVKSIKIYSTSGNLVTQGVVKNNRFNVSTLATGVYIFVSENNAGTVTKSKFIKK